MPSAPQIVTTDLDGPQQQDVNNSPHTPVNQQQPGSDPSHLSPSNQGALAPGSPTLTTSSSVHFNEDGSPTSQIPPSYHSDIAGATTANNSLSVPDSPSKHKRKWSIGTWSSNGKERDVSVVETEDNDSDKDGDKKKKKKGKEELVSHLDPSKDTTDPSPFKEKPSTLAMLVDPKSLDDLEKIGGVQGLLNGLGVDPSRGLPPENSSNSGAPRSSSEQRAIDGGDGAQWSATYEQRRKVYGRNDLPERKSKSIFQLMWEAFKDKVLILLSVAAVISLALGLYQDFGTEPHITWSDECPNGCEDPKVDWIEGVAIMVAIIIVVLVGSINDWQKERQFKKLNEKREDRTVKVLRGGNEQVINVRDIVVGDIAMLEPGEILPVDGVFLRGHNVRCDESGATGESDAIKKSTYDECIRERDNLQPGQRQKLDCFMVSGAKVLEGVGEYVVTSVGTYSFNGRIMMAMRTDTEETPLQLKLNKLAELIAKAGAGSGLILFISLMIRFFVQLRTDPNRSANDKAQAFVQILIISVTLIVVAVPEGLPLAVTLALAFATKRMTKQNLLVRVLGSCETMGHATVICTDKTGTLTQNVMSVVAGSLGVHGKFVRNLKENAERNIANDEDPDRQDFAFDASEMNEVASPEVVTLFNEAICINSTAFEDTDQDGNVEFVGSKTETALLRFAKELGWPNYKTTRESAQVVQMIPFSSEQKSMGVVIKTATGYRLYVKGASEVITAKCTHYIDVTRHTEGLHVSEYDAAAAENIQNTIMFYANQTLRTLALCYRDFPQWPPAGAEGTDPEQVPFALTNQDLTLIAITGIEDPLRPGVADAVRACQGAGVAVKMCTGDNVLTARSIARQCGIFTAGGLVMEGPVFRALSDADRHLVAPRLQILARSSPEDKKLLVRTLKEQGEVVGVTGDGTNDGPALKLANVGFAMGIAGTEVAKEASDIILMDDSFSNIVLAIMWGRCVNDSVKKFLQFQISVNITAVVITYISAVASASETSVLTAVQLLWVNLIMDTFAALALATDPATPASLRRKPDRKDEPLINTDMVKMIVIQATYQICVCLVLHFAGARIIGLDPNDVGDVADLRTLVFNCFVFCQIFNQLNCRRLDRHFNVLEGFFKNYWFMLIFCIMVGGQILIIEVGGAAFQVTRLYGRDWGISIIVGFISLPLGVIVRLLPTAPVTRFLIKIHVYKDPSKQAQTDLELMEENVGDYTYNPALEKVKNDLTTFSSIRGGRLRGSSLMVGRSRHNHKELKKANIALPSLLTMVPTLIAGTVGAGSHWIYQTNPEALADPANQEQTKSTVDLYTGKVQLHPDTDPNDPLYAKFGLTPPSQDEKKSKRASRLAPQHYTHSP